MADAERVNRETEAQDVGGKGCVRLSCREVEH